MKEANPPPLKNQVYKIPEHANQSTVTENILWLNPGQEEGT